MQAAPDAGDRAQGGIPLVGRLALVFFCPLSGLAQGGITPILPQLSEHFAALPNADALVRLLATGLSGAMIVGSIAAALLARRIAPRTLLLGALLLFAVAGAAGYLIDDIYGLLVSRALLGIATAVAGVMTAAIITSQVAPALRDRWLGFYVVTGTFGALLIFPLIAIVARADWRSVFLIHLLALPVLLWVATTVPRGPAPNRTDGASAARGPFPVALTLLGLCCGAVMTAALIFMPYHLRAIGAAGPEKMSALMMACALTGGILSFAYGWLRARLSIVQIFVAGFLCNGAGMLIAVLSGNYAGALLGLLVFGMGVGLIAPNLFAASAAAAPPERRASVIGYVRAGIYAGPLVAQLPLEPLSRGFGPSAALIAVGLFALAMTVGVQFTRRALAPATA